MIENCGNRNTYALKVNTGYISMLNQEMEISGKIVNIHKYANEII
jgi:hypothetical protein